MNTLEETLMSKLIYLNDDFLRSPILHYDNARLKLKFEGYPLKQYATKTDLKNISNIDASSFALK